jgi:hypothetical protein
MALLTGRDKGVKGPSIPKKIEDRIRRGRQEMLKDAPARRVAYKFWKGEHYWYVNEKNRLAFLNTVTFASGGGKPPHRIRKKFNYVRLLTEAKVSAATQRVPGYEITPSTGDYADREAAILAAGVAAYGYDKWGVRRVTTKVVTNALVQREGFAMPYWDPNVGPFTQQINLETGDVEVVGRGEIKILTLSRSEVMWEPGVDFHDSRWYAVERAVPVDEIEAIPGFFGGKVQPNATSSDVPSDREQENMALLTHYLERPCKEYPNGRSVYTVDGTQICPEDRYPAISPDGQVLDEPVIHRLSYVVNPEGDDQGFVDQLIDPQQTVNDCTNKLLEWKNRCLNPQMSAPIGAFQQGVTQLDDTPGIIRYYRPVGGQKPEWETPPALPAELQQIRQMAIQDMRALAADVDVQAEADLAAKTATQAVEQASLRWQSFLGDLAEFHSRLMRHCLSLVQQFYDTPREVEMQGDYSPYTLRNFTGQDLRSQVNVRVAVGSLVSQSRAAIREEAAQIATLFPGAISPEAFIASINQGVGQNMLRSYERHMARAARIVDLCKQGMDALAAVPKRFDPDVPAKAPDGTPLFVTGPDGLPVIDPVSGQPVPLLGDDVPGWMPRPQDNVDIWRQVIGDYMTSAQFEQLPPENQQVFDLVWRALDQIEQDRAQAQMMQRDMAAAGQGLDNAAKPQAPPPLPDRSQTNPQ